jgi:AcrR family transcriptional regulator
MSYMRSEKRQQQILACAKQVFAERGFHASSVSHICEAAGIGRGTLYQYFANKKAVFTAILREALGRVQALMLANRSRDRTLPPEQLSRDEAVQWSARRLRQILEAVFDDEQTLRILLREAVGLDVDVEKIVNEIDDGLISIVAEDLERSQKIGVVRADLTPRLTATLMVGGIEKLALAALRSHEPVDLEPLSLEAARLHLSGVLSDRVTDGGTNGTH